MAVWDNYTPQQWNPRQYGGPNLQDMIDQRGQGPRPDISLLDQFLQGTWDRGPGSTNPVMPGRGPGSTLPVQPGRGPGFSLPVMPGQGGPGFRIPEWNLQQPYPQPPGPTPNPNNPYPQPPGPTPFPNGPIQPAPGRSGDNPYLRGGQGGDYESPLSKAAGKLNPQAELTRAFSRGGLGGNNRMGQFAQNQSGKILSAFDAAQLDNNQLNIRDFLGRGGGIANNLLNEYRGMSANQRGLNNAARSNVIRWG